MKPSKNAPCPCGSGKIYKRCCLLTGGITVTKTGGYRKFNKRLNRYETNNDHHYAAFNYQGCNYLHSKPYVGKIKCKLVHAEGNSVIVPDYIFLRNGWIQPIHFTAPRLVKLDEVKIGCDFFIDIQEGHTIKVRFYNTDMIHAYTDASQLFTCEIYGPADIEQYSSGDFVEQKDMIYLKLYHHTDERGFTGITGSNSLRSSRWNYRGSKECTNHHFVYSTHVPEMKHASDLITVAMSADGTIDYSIDSFTPPAIMPKDYRERFKDFIYTAEVYRSTTSDRKHSLAFFVPIDCIDTKHVYRHYQGHTVFFEVCFPYIHRIKAQANVNIEFDKDYFITESSSVVKSDYSIMGDAGTKDGLAAPFEEEDTKFVYKIENCGNQTIHDFWFTHANTDLFTDKTISALQVKEVIDNPTILK